MIDVTAAGCHRMSPRRALDRSEPQVRKQVTLRRQADVREDQYVGRIGAHAGGDRIDATTQGFEMVATCRQLGGQSIGKGSGEITPDIELVSRQIEDPALEVIANRAGAKLRRKEAHAGSSATPTGSIYSALQVRHGVR